MLKENIGVTRNYTLFKFKDTNRDIDKRNLLRIDKKVKKEGWRKHPILVNQYGEVIDGQHRLVYAQAHDLPVYYVVGTGLQEDDCQIMNTTRKKWEAKDYIKYYANQDNENYVRLAMLKDEFDFLTIPTIISAIKRTGGYGGENQKSIVDGKLKLTDEEFKEVKQKLRFYKKCEPYLNTIHGKLTQLYNAIGFCYDLPEVDNDRLLEVIKTRVQTITPPANMEWALKGLEEIYNRQLRAENKVYIFTEYKKAVADKSKCRINRGGERR